VFAARLFNSSLPGSGTGFVYILTTTYANKTSQKDNSCLFATVMEYSLGKFCGLSIFSQA
jgi:hypothetical protein